MQHATQYDSLLYGNGLTLATLHKIALINCTNIELSLLSMNDFCRYLFTGPIHRKVYRDFLKTFNQCPSKYENSYTAGRQFMIDYMDEITTYGFEATIGKHIFENQDNRFSDMIAFWYGFPNYWYNKLQNEVILLPQVQLTINNIADKIKSYNFKNIFTLNFDTLLDHYIFPQHLHGKFILPYKSYADLIVFNDKAKKSYLHKYVLDANGMKKLDALDKLRISNIQEYQLDFFTNSNLNIGRLLIYGVAFRTSEIMTPEFLREFPEHENAQLIHLTDGHIIAKLESMLHEGRLRKIDLTYFSEDDKNNFLRLLSFSKLEQITNLIHISDVSLI